MTTLAELKDNGFDFLKSARRFVPALLATVGSVVSSCGDKGDEPTPVTPEVDKEYVAIMSPKSMQVNFGAFVDNGFQYYYRKAEFKGATTSGYPVSVVYGPRLPEDADVSFQINRDAVAVNEPQKNKKGFLTGTRENGLMAEFSSVNSSPVKRVGHTLIKAIYVIGGTSDTLHTDTEFGLNLRNIVESAQKNQTYTTSKNGLTAIGIEGLRLIPAESAEARQYKPQ